MFDGLRARAYLDLMGGTFLELPETEEEARQIKDVLSAPDRVCLCGSGRTLHEATS